MEADMKSISAGKMTKEEVVKKGCQLYKDVLVKSLSKSAILEESVRHYFQQI